MVEIQAGQRFCSTACNTAVLEGHCFDHRLDRDRDGIGMGQGQRWDRDGDCDGMDMDLGLTELDPELGTAQPLLV